MYILEFETRGEIRKIYPSNSLNPYYFNAIEEAEALLQTFPGFQKNPQNYSIALYDAGSSYTQKTFSK